MRNHDLTKTLTVEQIQTVLELVFEDDMGYGYKNPEGFGGHYADNNRQAMSVDEVMDLMVREADR